jgi:hypothetical protein
VGNIDKADNKKCILELAHVWKDVYLCRWDREIVFHFYRLKQELIFLSNVLRLVSIKQAYKFTS